jgi:citrate synthase
VNTAVGLDNVVVAETALSAIDGERGHLVYRGHWAKELALSSSLEEVAYLLWYGRLPSQSERTVFLQKWREAQKLSEEMQRWLMSLPRSLSMSSVLQSAVAALSDESQFDWPPTPDQALQVAAKIPTIIGVRRHALQGVPFDPPSRDWTHAQWHGWCTCGSVLPPRYVRALEAYLILTAEHGLNASTFTARVVTSTQADLPSVLSAAIGALKGPLHGGAPSHVEMMLEEIGDERLAEAYLRSRLDQGKRLMGFGHRVYKTVDPRAEALKAIAQEMAEEEPWFRLALHVEKEAVRLLQEYKPGRQLYANVEFYASAVLKAIGLPKELYTPTFISSRVIGWAAHALEQAAANRIIRPDSRYIGPMPQE